MLSTLGPAADAVDSVTAWLKASGISDYQINGAFVDFATDVTTANKVFNASYQEYTSGNVTKLRTLKYSIPDDIQKHVIFLDPSTNFGSAEASSPEAPVPAQRRRSEKVRGMPRADASCSLGLTPTCVKEIYNVGNYTPTVESGSRIGFGSFLGYSSLRNDVAQFEDVFGIPRQNVTKVLIAGGVDTQDPTLKLYSEADLDVENILGLAAPLPVTEYITGGLP